MDFINPGPWSNPINVVPGVISRSKIAQGRLKIGPCPSWDLGFTPVFLYDSFKNSVSSKVISLEWFRSSNGLKWIFLNAYIWQGVMPINISGDIVKLKYKNMHKDWLRNDWFPGAWTLKLNFWFYDFKLKSLLIHCKKLLFLHLRKYRKLNKY